MVEETIVQVPVAEAVYVRGFPWELTFLIIGIVVFVVCLICLYVWLRRREQKDPGISGVRTFFYPSTGKIIGACALATIGLFGLFSCFMTGVESPTACEVAGKVAILPMILVEPLGDLMGGNDSLIILFAIIIAVLLYYVLVCCVVWCWKRIFSHSRGGQ